MKLKDTLKLMSISLFQYQLVFFALKNLPLIDLLHGAPVEKVKVEYLNELENVPFELDLFS